jgi:rieske iron-sulfur protein
MRTILEESKEKQPSQQKAPEGESKPAPAPQPTPAVQAPAPPPRPVPAAPPRTPPTPAAARPVPPKDTGRRSFLKALFVLGAILSIVPFVPWGTFLGGTVSGGTAQRTLGQQLVIDDLPAYGAAAGKKVNVNDLTTFPPNDHWIVTYPTSGDITIDTENPDTFQKYELIRLPESLGGANKKATDFVAFSKVCVHLWCSPNYNPASGHEQYECPCHGSIYRIPDGKAVAGPASLQAFPTDAIPMATLQADSSGNLYMFYPNRDPSLSYPNDLVADTIEANGDLGYGRDYESYENFIKPRGEIPGEPAVLDTAVSG